MKRTIIVMATVLLIIGIMFVGCGKPVKETPITPITPITPTEPVEEVKPIEWTFVSFIPPFDIYATEAEAWAKRMEEATGGRFKVNFYWAESLVKLTGLFEAVAAGTADVATHPLAPWPERLSLIWIGTLPGIFDNAPQAGKVGIALFDKYEELRTQLLPCRLMWLQTPGPFEISSKRPVHTMEDFSGLKISTGQKYEMLAFEALGAVPIPVHPTEVYHALETGVIDACCLDFNGQFIWRLYEPTQYRTGNTLGLMSFMLTTMNIASYDNLPADIKQEFDRLTDPTACTNAANGAFVGFAAGTLEEMKAHDMELGNPEIYYLPAEEHARWVETIRPVTEVWVEENEARGYPARAMLEDAVSFAEQYK